MQLALHFTKNNFPKPIDNFWKIAYTINSTKLIKGGAAMINIVTMAAVRTLVMGFCFNVLLPAWAMVNAFLGI